MSEAQIEKENDIQTNESYGTNVIDILLIVALIFVGCFLLAGITIIIFDMF